MASSNPNKLLSIKDSLLQSSSKTYIAHSIALAHKTLGDSAITEGDYEKAKEHFTKALKLSPNDSLYKYNQLMVEGHLLQKSGKKDNKVAENQGMVQTIRVITPIKIEGAEVIDPKPNK